MANRAMDWFRQSERDLEQAEDSKLADRHELACFASQQAAEKVIKTLHLSLGQEAWGHVVAKLIRELTPLVKFPQELIGKASVLDSYYIPPRYPNGFAEGAPFEHYGALQSREAIAMPVRLLNSPVLKWQDDQTVK